jgi:hypothetical protein
MVRVCLQCDLYRLDAICFRPILVTHLFPGYQGQHELRLRHHGCGYRIILVRGPVSASFPHSPHSPLELEFGISPGMPPFSDYGNEPVN